MWVITRILVVSITLVLFQNGNCNPAADPFQEVFGGYRYTPPENKLKYPFEKEQEKEKEKEKEKEMEQKQREQDLETREMEFEKQLKDKEDEFKRREENIRRELEELARRKDEEEERRQEFIDGLLQQYKNRTVEELNRFSMTLIDNQKKEDELRKKSLPELQEEKQYKITEEREEIVQTGTGAPTVTRTRSSSVSNSKEETDDAATNDAEYVAELETKQNAQYAPGASGNGKNDKYLDSHNIAFRNIRASPRYKLRDEDDVIYSSSRFILRRSSDVVPLDTKQ